MHFLLIGLPMNQKPEKPPSQTEQEPHTGSELSWIIVFLAICLMANSWVISLVSEQEENRTNTTHPLTNPSHLTPPSVVPERPSRDRTDRDERPWRDPSMLGLPNI